MNWSTVVDNLVGILSEIVEMYDYDPARFPRQAQQLTDNDLVTDLVVLVEFQAKIKAKGSPILSNDEVDYLIEWVTRNTKTLARFNICLSSKDGGPR